MWARIAAAVVIAAGWSERNSRAGGFTRGSGGLWIRYVGNHPSMSFGVSASVSSRSVSGRSANISSQDSFARIRPPSARLDIFARRHRCSAANTSSAGYRRFTSNDSNIHE